MLWKYARKVCHFVTVTWIPTVACRDGPNACECLKILVKKGYTKPSPPRMKYTSKPQQDMADARSEEESSMDESETETYDESDSHDKAIFTMRVTENEHIYSSLAKDCADPSSARARQMVTESLHCPEDLYASPSDPSPKGSTFDKKSVITRRP